MQIYIFFAKKRKKEEENYILFFITKPIFLFAPRPPRCPLL